MSSGSNRHSRHFSDALDPISSTLANSTSTLSIVKEALLTPFQGESRRSEGLSRLHECQCVLFGLTSTEFDHTHDL